MRDRQEKRGAAAVYRDIYSAVCIAQNSGIDFINPGPNATSSGLATKSNSVAQVPHFHGILRNSVEYAYKQANRQSENIILLVGVIKGKKCTHEDT